MDKLQGLDTEDTAALIEHVTGIFMPLLEAKRAEIEQVPITTFQYGPTKRHQLDVYYPMTPHPSGKTKILVFLYGGGFISGDRQMPPPANLIYANVGSYFARRGFITVIPDYRLIPEAVFPTGPEDVRDAVVWLIKNPQHLTTPNTPNPQTQGIFISGHSAGAIHAFTSIVTPETAEPAAFRSSIAGLILCGGAYDFNRLQPGWKLYSNAIQYYRGTEGMKSHAPITLFEMASDIAVAALPRIVMVVAEKEPKWALESNDEFRVAYEKRTGKVMPLIVAKKHNHFSFYCAMSTGEGEEWAEDVIQWIGV